MALNVALLPLHSGVQCHLLHHQESEQRQVDLSYFLKQAHISHHVIWRLTAHSSHSSILSLQLFGVDLYR